MAVVEELTSRVGFKLFGQSDLARYEAGMVRARSKMGAFSKAMGLAMRYDAGQMIRRDITLLGSLAKVLRSGVSPAALMAGRGLRALAGAAAGVASSIGLVVAGVSAMVLGFVHARRQAALLRRDLQLTAGGQRTRAVNVDKISRGFSAIGAKPEEAGTLIGSIAEKVNSAINEGKGFDDFTKQGLGSPLDKRGNRRDPAAILLDGVARYMDIQARARGFRTEEAKADKAGRKGVAATAAKKASAQEVTASKLAGFLGFSDQLVGALRGMKDWAEFVSRMTKFNVDNPSATKDEEADMAARAQQWAEIGNKMDAVGGAIGRYADTIVDKFIKPLDDGLSSIIGLLRGANLLSSAVDPKTNKQILDRARGSVTAKALEFKDMDRAVFEAGRPVTWLEGFFGSTDPENAARGDLQEAVERYRTHLQRRDAAEKAGEPADRIHRLQSMLEGSIGGVVDALQRLDKVTAWPDEGSRPKRGEQFGDMRPGLERYAERMRQMQAATSPEAGAAMLNRSLSVALTGSADVSGRADVGVEVTASSELLRVVKDAKQATVDLKGTLRTAGSAIGRSSATGLGTATSGSGSP